MDDQMVNFSNLDIEIGWKDAYHFILLTDGESQDEVKEAASG